MGPMRRLDGVRALVAVLAILPVMGCHIGDDRAQDKAPGPIHPDVAPYLEIQAYCNVWFELPSGNPWEGDLVLPNRFCADNSDPDDAHPLLGIPPSDPRVVVLSIRNPHTTAVPLASIVLETDPTSSRELAELVEFRERYDECLERLSDPPPATIPPAVSLAPKILQPGETCYAELGLIDPAPQGPSRATGWVVFTGAGGTELARLPISVN